jgi:putative membrane protein
MIAHSGALDGWHDVPGAWSPEPLLLLGLCLAVALDIALRGRARRQGADHLALGGVVLVLVGPIDALAEVSMAAHMVQHLVLLFVVAPALAVARPWHNWRSAFGHRRRTQFTRVARRIPLALRRGPAQAIIATATTTAALWIWHLPAAYDLADRSDWWHGVDHLSLIASATWFWEAVHRLRIGRQPGAALGMLAFASMSGTALGALLVFGEPGAYPRPLEFIGLSPAEDQQLAGLLMSMVPAVGLLFVMARTLLEELRSAGPSVADRRTAQQL